MATATATTVAAFTAAAAVAAVTIAAASVAAVPVVIAVAEVAIAVVLPGGSAQTAALPPSTVDRTDDRAVAFSCAGGHAQGGGSRIVASVRAITNKAHVKRREPLAGTSFKEVIILLMLL